MAARGNYDFFFFWVCSPMINGNAKRYKPFWKKNVTFFIRVVDNSEIGGNHNDMRTYLVVFFEKLHFKSIKSANRPIIYLMNLIIFRDTSRWFWKCFSLDNKVAHNFKDLLFSPITRIRDRKSIKDPNWKSRENVGPISRLPLEVNSVDISLLHTACAPVLF